MSIAAKCTCGKSPYYCVGGEGCRWLEEENVTKAMNTPIRTAEEVFEGKYQQFIVDHPEYNSLLALKKLPEYKVFMSMLEEYGSQFKAQPQVTEEAYYPKAIIDELIKNLKIVEFKSGQPRVNATINGYVRALEHYSQSLLPKQQSSLTGRRAHCPACSAYARGVKSRIAFQHTCGL